MLDNIFTTSFASINNTDFSTVNFMLCTLCSLFMGVAIAFIHKFRNHCSKGFACTLALLPVMVQVVIMLVNGNMGTGIAIMGAFSLVRFRSVPGNARDIASVFLAMTAGLASGTGYIAIALLFVAVTGIFSILLVLTGFGEENPRVRHLKITIPESLDYTDVFDDIMSEYTYKNKLMGVKTTNMGALFSLNYEIELKDSAREKEFIDKLRCRNGNLEISCGMITTAGEEL